MKPILAILICMLLCTIVRAAGDFTIEWRQLIPPPEHNLELLRIGDAHVAMRLIPPKKQNDPPRFGVFLDKSMVVKTPIYPGKWCHFALVRRDDKLKWFVNGYPDPSNATTTAPGNAEARLAEMKLTDSALSDADILARFKSQLQPHKIVTVGHRGMNKYAPENTRISYVQLTQTHAPIAEMDLALTKDGRIVLMHDPTVDRTTGKHGKVSDFTVDEITQFDAGSWKDAKYKGEPVPTLEQVGEVCRDKAIMMLDLKATGQGKQIAAWLASSRHPRDQVILAPWTDEEGADLRKYIPDVAMVRLTTRIPTDNFDDAYFARMKQIGFSGFSVSYPALSDSFVKAAHKNDMKVYVWTVNDPPEVAGSVLLGVDGIITDDAASTMKLVEELGSASN